MAPLSAELQSPDDPSRPPRELVGELRALVGEAACVQVCAVLLSGADPEQYRGQLAYLGGRPGRGWPNAGWRPYWPRVWGARGLLYVWDASATGAVVAGLADPHWRVAEMCLKVSALREVAAARDPAVGLGRHELARVRATAIRTLGLVGDTEHAPAVRAAADDEDSSVRRAAELALERQRQRLDL